MTMNQRQLFAVPATLLLSTLLVTAPATLAQSPRSGISLSGVIKPADTLRVQSSVGGRILEIYRVLLKTALRYRVHTIIAVALLFTITVATTRN